MPRTTVGGGGGNDILVSKNNFTVFLNAQNRTIQIKNDNGRDAHWSDNPPILQENSGTVHAKSSTDWIAVNPFPHAATTFTFTFLDIRVPSSVSKLKTSGIFDINPISTPGIQREFIGELLAAQAEMLVAQAKILTALANILEEPTEVHIEMDLETEHLSENQ